MNEEEYDKIDMQIRKEDMSHKYTKEIVCSKGHKKIKACLMLDDWDEYNWLLIECVTCNKTLFYNGA